MQIIINRAWCKGCGICVAFCRPGALGLENADADPKAVWTQANCVRCGLCELYCPDLAIEIVKNSGESETPVISNTQEGAA